MRENLSSGLTNDSDFVIRLLESIISTLASSGISTFSLVSVAEQAGFNITVSGTPEDRFCRVEAQLCPD